MLFSGVIGAISAIPAFALSTPQASDMQGLEALSQYNSIYVITIVINLVLGVVLYFATAAMAEKKLSM
jgi:heme/copper-type cytochrome/quinol oxidase subunit 2